MLPISAQCVTTLAVLALLLFAGPLSTPFGPAYAGQEAWPVQDGSLVLTQTSEGTVLSFPYVPFLSMSPAWTPAYPREYQQPVEPVLPLPGLAGKVSFRLLGAPGSGNLQVLSRTPYSAEASVLNGSSEIRVSWVCALGQPAVVFECASHGQGAATLEICLGGFPARALWATPGKKMKHDWGSPTWEWKPGERYLLQTYGNPVDATHSPSTALWIGGSTTEWKGAAPTYHVSAAHQDTLQIPLRSGGTVRFGFEHADNLETLNAQLASRRGGAVSLSRLSGAWNAWLADSAARIKSRTGIDPSSLPPEKRRVLENNLLTTRQLFLSNGAVLTEPMTPSSFSVSIAEQGVALNHWRRLGLEFPYLREQAELSRYNRLHQRSIEVPVFRSGGTMETLSQGRVILAAPDPDSPPDKASFDTVLGYVISGGHLTLVDGVDGFRGKEGWWKESGAADLADYAIRMMGVPVDPASRHTLDEEGLAPTVNTFTSGAAPLSQGTSTTPQSVTVLSPKPGGYLLLSPASSEEQTGVQILSGRIGGEAFQPFTPEEDRFLAGGYAPRCAYDEFGDVSCCDLVGEGFRAYKIPASATGPMEFTLRGGWTIAWSQSLPPTHVTMRKKAFQTWYSRELMSVPILRLCHPVVYSGTYTCRVFDITGTEESPFLYTKVGRGSFVWLGLPRDYVLQGSDTGSDLQNSLRDDPTYDLVRLTFAFHDPKHAGADRASRTPFSGWGRGWSQPVHGDPEAFHSFFAWKPVESAGWATQVMNGWVEDAFTNALEIPRSEGKSVPSHALITRDIGGGRRIIELPENAFRYAVYRGLERTSGTAGKVWLQEDSHRKAADIAKDLSVMLEGFGEGAVYARAIMDGSPQAAIPASTLMPRAAWAATEIAPADFPGGATVQARLMTALANDPATIQDTQAMAVIAACDEVHREPFLTLLLQHHTEPALGLIGGPGKRFDLATAVPTLRALILTAKP